MAKVLAPLFSFAASGKLADALVYLPWKGLNNVRKYVVPANPQTGPQTTQRGYMTDAVTGVHAAMASPTNPLSDTDTSAFALLGSLMATPRTWFNTIVKQIIDQLVAGLLWSVLGDFTITPGVDQLTVQGYVLADGGSPPTNGAIHYGTSKTALINSIACTVVELNAGKVVPTLVTGTKYFLQYRPTTPAGQTACNSGIYFGTPT